MLEYYHSLARFPGQRSPGRQSGICVFGIFRVMRGGGGVDRGDLEVGRGLLFVHFFPFFFFLFLG